MEEDKNRINLEDLPKAEEELTPEQAKDVQGGANTYTGATTINAGTLSLGATTVGGTLGSASGNTIGGSLSTDSSNPTRG